jgi:hypothetical protein
MSAEPEPSVASAREGTETRAISRATSTFLAAQRATIVDDAESILARTQAPHYQSLTPATRRNQLDALYDRLLEAAVSRDLGGVLTYARQLAQERFDGGYDLSEIQVAINALEETIWRQILSELPHAELADALVLVSTILGAAKDTLAREYVSLATHAHAPSLDLRKLFAGPG